MATKKSKISNETLDAYNEERLVSKYDKSTKWPKVVRGSHSIRTEYEDGRVEFETIWEDLVNDVNSALREYESKQLEQLESLDPAERSWYYDGHGVRRPKETTTKTKPAKITATKTKKAK